MVDVAVESVTANSPKSSMCQALFNLFIPVTWHVVAPRGREQSFQKQMLISDAVHILIRMCAYCVKLKERRAKFKDAYQVAKLKTRSML